MQTGIDEQCRVAPAKCCNIQPPSVMNISCSHIIIYCAFLCDYFLFNNSGFTSKRLDLKPDVLGEQIPSKTLPCRRLVERIKVF